MPPVRSLLTSSCQLCEALRALSVGRGMMGFVPEKAVWQLCGGWIGVSSEGERQPAGQGGGCFCSPSDRW